jgi:hypothetical protein
MAGSWNIVIETQDALPYVFSVGGGLVGVKLVRSGRPYAKDRPGGRRKSTEVTEYSFGPTRVSLRSRGRLAPLGSRFGFGSELSDPRPTKSGTRLFSLSVEADL